MEKIIHFTVPEKLTSVQAQSIERARELHPTWEVKVWQDPVRPDGCLLEKYWPKANSGAQLSDLLRLDILYKWGGVYVDGDLRLLKPLDGLIDKFELFVASETGNSLEGAIIGARKAHTAIKGLIDDLLSNEPDWSLSPDKTTGPDLFARVLRWDKCVTVLPRDTFYCYDADALSKKRHRHSYGEHLWDYSWKHVGRDIRAPLHPFDWKSRVKRLIKPILISSFQLLHRVRSIDPFASEKKTSLGQPKFYNRSGEIVVQTVHGFYIIVDGTDTSVAPRLIFGGAYDLAEEAFVKRILHGGDWVLDVGANVGSFSILAGQCIGSFGRVFAYEPNPRALRLLSKSIALNSMHDRLVLRPVQVGNIAGSVRVGLTREVLRDGDVGNEDIEALSNVPDRTRGVESLVETNVPRVTLDNELPIDLPIKLLKVEVGGQEVAVLKGAHRLLERRCVDFVLVEVMRGVTGSHWTELLSELRWLTDANYVACTLAKDGSLVEHKSLAVALGKLKGHNIVLKARDQYWDSVQSKERQSSLKSNGRRSN